MYPRNVNHLIETIGYIGLFVMIFAETGLLIGFFLPGDSLLFTAGFLASQNIFDIWILVPVCVIAAILGDATGYQLGRRYGRGLFSQPEARFFKPQHVLRSEAFYERHGGRAIFLARFVPFARTFVSTIAGISRMSYRQFASYNIAGGICWGAGITLLGFFLGHAIPSIDRYLLPVIGVIVVASVVPSAYHLWKESRIDGQTSLSNRLRHLAGRTRADTPIPPIDPSQPSV
jgi:membrane-associated protein